MCPGTWIRVPGLESSNAIPQPIIIIIYIKVYQLYLYLKSLEKVFISPLQFLL